MSLKYCPLCERNVEASRKIGVGTLILCICTAFFWILAIPFYSKRCPICGHEDLENARRVTEIKKEVQAIKKADLKICPICAQEIDVDTKKCEHCGYMF